MSTLTEERFEISGKPFLTIEDIEKLIDEKVCGKNMARKIFTAARKEYLERLKEIGSFQPYRRVVSNEIAFKHLSILGVTKKSIENRYKLEKQIGD